MRKRHWVFLVCLFACLFLKGKHNKSLLFCSFTSLLWFPCYQMGPSHTALEYWNFGWNQLNGQACKKRTPPSSFPGDKVHSESTVKWKGPLCREQCPAKVKTINLVTVLIVSLAEWIRLSRKVWTFPPEDSLKSKGWIPSHLAGLCLLLSPAWNKCFWQLKS